MLAAARTRSPEFLNLLLQCQLPHAKLVDSFVVARDALLEETVHLTLDVRPFARELQAPDLHHALCGHEHRRDRLGSDFRYQPGFLCT